MDGRSFGMTHSLKLGFPIWLTLWRIVRFFVLQTKNVVLMVPSPLGLRGAGPGPHFVSDCKCEILRRIGSQDFAEKQNQCDQGSAYRQNGYVQNHASSNDQE